MRDTVRKTLSAVATAAGLVLLTTGCHHDASSSFNNMTRQQQEQALHGDPVKGAQMAAEMRAKYANGGGRPSTGPAQANTGAPKR